MKKYIAFLRGINVGSYNRVKIADLEKAFTGMGFLEVRAFIQSGNVIFTTEKDAAADPGEIESGIRDSLGIMTSVILRTPEELENIIANCPFTDVEISEAENRLGAEVSYVCLLSAPLSYEASIYLEKYKNEYEGFQVSGRDIYMFLRKGIRGSKLAVYAEKLGPCTIRNLKMLGKLYTSVTLTQQGQIPKSERKL